MFALSWVRVGRAALVCLAIVAWLSVGQSDFSFGADAAAGASTGSVATVAVSTTSAANGAPATGALSGVGAIVGQMLDTGWKLSPENYDACQGLFSKASTAAPRDGRVHLAMALVALKQYKHDDADRYLDQVLAANPGAGSNPQNISAREIKIWMSESKKDTAVAQSGMHDLAAAIASGGPANSSKSAADSTAANLAGAASDDAKNAARWLGGAVGYFTGPAASEMQPLGVGPLDTDMKSLLTGPLADVYQEGKDAAAKQYAQLQKDQAAARADMKTKNAAKRADDIKKTQAESAAVGDKLKKLDDGSTTTATDGKDAKGKKGDTTTATTTDNDRPRLLEHAQQLKAQLEAAMAKRHRNEGDIMKLRGELVTVDQQLQQAGGASAPDSKEAQKKKLQEAQASLDAKVKQLQKETDDVTTTPLDAKVNSLATYAPVDMEVEKQRILDSYAGK